MQVSIYAGLLHILVSLSKNQCLHNRKNSSGARLKPSKLPLEYCFSIYWFACQHTSFPVFSCMSIYMPNRYICLLRIVSLVSVYMSAVLCKVLSGHVICRFCMPTGACQIL
jgi:hypothetical protein